MGAVNKVVEKKKVTDGNEMEDEARRLLSCAVEAEGIDDDGGGN